MNDRVFMFLMLWGFFGLFMLAIPRFSLSRMYLEKTHPLVIRMIVALLLGPGVVLVVFITRVLLLAYGKDGDDGE